MARKRSWFNLVRKFFVSETECPQDKKDKRRKWVFFGRLKVKSRLASISGPTPSPPREGSTLSEAEEEQSKRALDVALATAVESAVAAAHAVLLHSTHQSERQLKAEKEGEEEKQSAMKIQYDREKQAIAAIKIQSTFRGYLARKALRALKGIVKLQAIIRGRNVRRQAMNTLKCLQSIVNIQSQVCAKRIQMAEGTCYCDNNKHSHSSSDKIIKMDTNSLKRWDGSILTKEEADALFVSKKEAALKRDRIKEYSFNHRNSAETERNKSNGRWKYWLEQWVDTQVSKSKEVEDLDTVMTSSPKPRVEYSYRGKQIKLRNMDEMEGIDSNSPIAAAPPRRSFHRKQNSLGEENCNSLSRSPVIPAYMAATESAKAKAVRSMSSPKLRPIAATPYDAFSDSYSPSKNKLSLLTSTATATARYGKQTSPSLKGLPTTPLKSNLTLNHLSFDSQCSFRTWDHHTNFP